MATLSISVPCAFVTYKKGRYRIIGKLTMFEPGGEPVLGVVWRRQRGTRLVVSVPAAVIELAEAVGARTFYVRCDRPPAWMRAINISELWRVGWYQPADGELYISLSQMRPVPWRRWAYAEVELPIDAVAGVGADANADADGDGDGDGDGGNTGGAVGGRCPPAARQLSLFDISVVGGEVAS